MTTPSNNSPSLSETEQQLLEAALDPTIPMPDVLRTFGVSLEWLDAFLACPRAARYLEQAMSVELLRSTFTEHRARSAALKALADVARRVDERPERARRAATTILSALRPGLKAALAPQPHDPAPPPSDPTDPNEPKPTLPQSGRGGPNEPDHPSADPAPAKQGRPARATPNYHPDARTADPTRSSNHTTPHAPDNSPNQRASACISGSMSDERAPPPHRAPEHIH